MVNNHFYPVTEYKKVMSLACSIKNEHKTALHRTIVSDKKDVKKDVVIMEAKANPVDVLVYEIVKNQLLPKNTKIYYHDNDVISFELGGQLYIINQNVEMTKQIYKHLGKDWNGESLYEGLSLIISEVAKVVIPKSTPNPHVYKTLTNANVKSRTHFGTVNGFTGKEIQELMKLGKAHCMDIRRCYSICMEDPYDPWIQLDFNDNWRPFMGSVRKVGLYQVITKDTTLLHGNNIYSSAILMVAAKNKIKFTVTHELIPAEKNCLDVSFFKPILKAIKEVSNGDEAMVKTLNNILSGILGKDMQHKTKVGINSDYEHVWNWFHKMGYHNERNIFVRNLDVGDQKYYLFGKTEHFKQSEVNLPMYIQIKDAANIRLFNMIKEMGGQLAYRKVDCAVTVGGQMLPESSEWGGYRESPLPKYLGPQEIKPAVFTPEKDWITHPYNDSDQFVEIMKIATELGGVLIQGRAGTGKSYCAKLIASLLKNVSKIAFTNKAALNIKGRTIHKFLRLDKNGKMNRTWLKLLQKSVKYIVVDEISMISKHLWRLLTEVKRSTGIIFILVGDYRQCGPVENEQIYHYFDHPAVKYLANHNLCDLTVKKRYDQQLWDELEDVNNVDISKYGNQICKKNICYYNATRKRVNTMIMMRCKPDDAVILEAIEGDKYTQEMWLYPGLPLIARRTVDNGDVMVNNEYFTVEKVEKDEVVCVADRTDEDDQPIKHRLKIPLDGFQRVLVANYCTTVHKSQGETITTDFTIWNWKYMCTRLKYTAMSRAKLPGQIHFADHWQTPEDCQEEVDVKKIIADKIASHKAYDADHNMETDIDIQFIYNMIHHQGAMCHHCENYMKLSGYHGGDNEQFTVDRVDDKIGHIKGNVVISCLKCNRSHRNRKM
jgi:hypothetical protein